MTQEFAKLWAAALRSKKYKQDVNACRLRTSEGGYCCLGVGAEVGVEAGIQAPAVLSPNGEYYNYPDDNSPDGLGDSFMPSNVMEWGGLGDNNPILFTDSHGIQRTASYCNDSANMSFEQIADLIDPPTHESEAVE
jgi:hypothetical protein